MAMSARTIGDKVFKTSGASRFGLFFEGAHYERSIAAIPRARMIMQSARI
jgi:hypothetical protein